MDRLSFHDFDSLSVVPRELGNRAVRCPDCGYRLTIQELNRSLDDYGFSCSCQALTPRGGWTDVFCMNIDVIHSNAPLLRVTPKYWWHITYRQEWTPPDNFYVHVGTPETVKWLRANYAGGHGALHLYRVALNPEVDVNPLIAHDYNDWPSYSTERERYTAVKYLNAVEQPGSISLLTAFGNLTDVKKVATFRGSKANMITDYREGR